MIIWRAIRWAFHLIREGRTKFLLEDAWMRLYKAWAEIVFSVRYGRRTQPSKPLAIHVETDHRVAFDSPDHLIPWGTKRDNSTNKKFVSVMKQRIEKENKEPYGALDLGCSGGQLVKDFCDVGWIAVGLEGSDFSLKHRRAHWPTLAGRNLFTSDITKPFQITIDGHPAEFNLVTAWEVLEHIPTNEVNGVFANILRHLKPGGYFVASTTSAPDVHDGVDLHQTKWSNSQWREMIKDCYPDLCPVDLQLRYYQFVRHNEERSILTYKRLIKG